MIKKRRDIAECEVIDFRKSARNLNEVIAVKTGQQRQVNNLMNQFQLKPSYGHGDILHLNLEDIELTISNYKLNRDTILIQKFEDDFIQISFLLEGEKIISLEGKEDILYERGESYLASIKSFDGYSRIIGGRIFKEVKVRLAASFLMKHGFVADLNIKELADENLILPITDELLVVLAAIEGMDFKGMARRMYIKAKIFELLAIQMENYRKGCFDKNFSKGVTSLKKLYLVKNMIKANLHKNFSMEELSKEVGLSKCALNKEFVRVFGHTVHHYSTTQKMKKAKTLLKNTMLPIYQIAEEVGYINATHFSAAFRRKNGETPKRFRGNR